ncbi:MAG: hypothetical protein Q4F72_10870 [Desulfovibrionaceae bacterium]|nr:hypothetical protein [Desulfovibrionaceae bacterium]
MPLPAVLLWGAAGFVVGCAGCAIKRGADEHYALKKAESLASGAHARCLREAEALEIGRRRTRAALEALGHLRADMLAGRLAGPAGVMETSVRDDAASTARHALPGELAALGAFGTAALGQTLAAYRSGTAAVSGSGLPGTGINAPLLWLDTGALSAGGFAMVEGSALFAGIDIVPLLSAPDRPDPAGHGALQRVEIYCADIDSRIARMQALLLHLEAVRRACAELIEALHLAAARFDAAVEEAGAESAGNPDAPGRMLPAGAALQRLVALPLLQEDGALSPDFERERDACLGEA